VGQLTVSIGYLKLTEVDMVASLVNKADLALYHSKNNGRDQVTSYLDLNVVETVQNDDDGIELF
jgi:PleD family two-component response regulator